MPNRSKRNKLNKADGLWRGTCNEGRIHWGWLGSNSHEILVTPEKSWRIQDKGTRHLSGIFRWRSWDAEEETVTEPKCSHREVWFCRTSLVQRGLVLVCAPFRSWKEMIPAETTNRTTHCVQEINKKKNVRMAWWASYYRPQLILIVLVVFIFFVV